MFRGDMPLPIVYIAMSHELSEQSTSQSMLTLKNNHKSLDTSPHYWRCRYASLSDVLWRLLGLWNWPVYCIGVNQGARYTWASVEQWRGVWLKPLISRHITLTILHGTQYFLRIHNMGLLCYVVA